MKARSGPARIAGNILAARDRWQEHRDGAGGEPGPFLRPRRGVVSRHGDAQEAALLGAASRTAARGSNTFVYIDFPFREACWASKSPLGLVLLPERAF